VNDKIKKTWETYASSWKAESSDEKHTLFEQCLDPNCEYKSPVIQTKGWQQLIDHMLEFHKNIPGGHFKTNYFLSYDGKSIAKWDMLNGENGIIGEGISYCEYNDTGKLTSMTGFFEAA